MKKLTYFMDTNSLEAVQMSSDYVDVRSLSANIAKVFNKPATARFVRLSAGQLFFYCTTGAASASATDVTTGLGSISVPATVQPFFMVEDLTSISVVSQSPGIVSAEWWA